MGLGPPDTFWRQTPRLLFVALRGGADAAEEDRKGRIAIGWWVENLSRAGKGFKALDRYTEPPKARPEPQSVDQQIAGAMAVHRLVASRAAKAA